MQLKRLMVQHTMRPTCPACLRPQTACICHLIAIVHSDIEVLILQHPLEVTETKGTARLLHLCLPNSRLLTGEIFDTVNLSSPKQSILLYPITLEDHSLGIIAPPSLDLNSMNNLRNIRLIIIDGTWRKSRKILIKNSYLQTLPRLVLQDLPAGQYTIRKARKPHQLSTLEAACAALEQMEQMEHQTNGYKAKFQPITESFNAFNAFITLQMQLGAK
jgi:DTW domain-containing protein